jgi:L-asparaginase
MGSTVHVVGHFGADGPGLFVLYTGGTIGMLEGPGGALVPLDLHSLMKYVPTAHELPVGLTVAAFEDPLDSAAIGVADWLAIADALVEHSPGHIGSVVLHGTDTMAYSASALSFLLEGVTTPIVLTGAQRPMTSIRSDGRENLTTALEVAAARFTGAPVVPEVTIFFNDVLLRGNRAVKVHASSYRGFASPNLAPLATAGVSLDFATDLLRAPGAGPLRRSGGMCTDVAVIQLHPAFDEASLTATLARDGLRGVVLQAYGAGNGPTHRWFLDGLRGAVDRGVTVVVTTQCRAGTVHAGLYATGAALLSTGAISAGDMTFEAALTKLMVLLDRHPDPDDVRRGMQQDLRGEITV